MVRDTSDRKRAELELRQLSENLERQVTERTAELRRSEERQRALLEVNHAVVTNLDRESLFEAVTRSLRKILYFDVAVICLRNRQRDAFKLFALERSSLPDSPFNVGEELDLRDTHIDWVLEHGKPLLRNDLAEGLRFDIEEKLMAKGIRSYVAVPLVTGKAALGTLNIGSKTPNRYSENEVSFLTDFAKQLALAVENMVAYEEIVQLKARLEDENIYLQEEIRTQHNFEEIIGQTTAIKKVLKAIETVAPTDAGVLILGETGTGKELIARAVHNLSRRKNRALIKVNCAAIPSGLVESELFGHEKGAFTGALAQKIGRFELADGGTIFWMKSANCPSSYSLNCCACYKKGSSNESAVRAPLK
jgi:formate hydrogenlyase transcriptional activator